MLDVPGGNLAGHGTAGAEPTHFPHDDQLLGDRRRRTARRARVGDYRSGRRQDSSVILVVPKSSAVSLVILLDERVPWPNPNKTAALGDGLLNFEERGFYVRPAYDGRINIGPQSKQGPSDTGIVHSFTGGAR